MNDVLCWTNQQSANMTYSSEDFERFYIRYKAEGVPHGETLQGFCSKNKVPYNLFIKWYQDTRYKVVPVTVDGMPENPSKEESANGTEQTERQPAPVRIMIDIRMTNGLHVSRRGMSYSELQRLVNNLEVLC